MFDTSNGKSMATTSVACEHCHAELGPSDVIEQSAGVHRCRRCGGRALRNYDAVADLHDVE